MRSRRVYTSKKSRYEKILNNSLIYRNYNKHEWILKFLQDIENNDMQAELFSSISTFEEVKQSMCIDVCKMFIYASLCDNPKFSKDISPINTFLSTISSFMRKSRIPASSIMYRKVDIRKILSNYDGVGLISDGIQESILIDQFVFLHFISHVKKIKIKEKNTKIVRTIIDDKIINSFKYGNIPLFHMNNEDGVYTVYLDEFESPYVKFKFSDEVKSKYIALS